LLFFVCCSCCLLWLLSLSLWLTFAIRRFSSPNSSVILRKPPPDTLVECIESVYVRAQQWIIMKGMNNICPAVMGQLPVRLDGVIKIYFTTICVIWQVLSTKCIRCAQLIAIGQLYQLADSTWRFMTTLCRFWSRLRPRWLLSGPDQLLDFLDPPCDNFWLMGSPCFTCSDDDCSWLSSGMGGSTSNQQYMFNYV
jgi:hypothetical protein